MSKFRKTCIILSLAGLISTGVCNAYFRNEYSSWVNSTAGKEQWVCQTTGFVMRLWGVQCNWLNTDTTRSKSDPTVIMGITTAEVQSNRIADLETANKILGLISLSALTLVILSVKLTELRVPLAGIALIILSWGGTVDALYRYWLTINWIK